MHRGDIWTVIPLAHSKAVDLLTSRGYDHRLPLTRRRRAALFDTQGQLRLVHLAAERVGRRLATATPEELAQVVEGLTEIVGG